MLLLAVAVTLVAVVAVVAVSAVPVRLPTNVVDVNVPVLGLYVKPVSVSIP